MMKRFFQSSSFLRWIIFILVCFGILFIIMKIYEPRSQMNTSESYTYLTSLDPKLIIQCQTEGNKFSPEMWLDLLAIRSTLTPQEANPLCQELLAGKSDLQNLSGLSKENAKLIAARRSILIKFPVFNPNTYQFPVEGSPWYIDTFGSDREGGRRHHEGTDLFSREGTPIYNVISGKVEKLGWNRLGGERVGVRGEDGNYYYYAHLQQINPALRLGQKIPKNTWIGSMGHTGDALTTPDHLHFGIELANGQWINPYSFLVVWQYYRDNPPLAVSFDIVYNKFYNTK